MSDSTLKKKQMTYRKAFAGELAKEVLSDLRVFCFATKSTWDIDEKRMYMNEGRREVFLQIMNMINVEFEEYYDYNPEDYME